MSTRCLFYPLIINGAAKVELARPQADVLRASQLAQDGAALASSQRMSVQSLVRRQSYHERVVQRSLASDRASFAGAIHTLMTNDLQPRLAMINQPATIILTANSCAPRLRVGPPYRRAYRELRQVVFRIIDESHHFIMFDPPTAFQQALTEAIGAD